MQSEVFMGNECSKTLWAVSHVRWLISNKPEFLKPSLFSSLSLMMRMELVYETLVCSPYNHLMCQPLKCWFTNTPDGTVCLRGFCRMVIDMKIESLND